eukprot:scaffold3998_cov153-Skeletonema_dohrnii-CCMP3373.AAC.10
MYGRHFISIDSYACRSVNVSQPAGRRHFALSPAVGQLSCRPATRRDEAESRRSYSALKSYDYPDDESEERRGGECRIFFEWMFHTYLEYIHVKNADDNIVNAFYVIYQRDNDKEERSEG